jgi:hypothetical protein
MFSSSLRTTFALKKKITSGNKNSFSIPQGVLHLMVVMGEGIISYTEPF